MKHSEWLRLKVEGDRVVASLRSDGFNCRKQSRRLSWHLCKGSVSYTLTWLPAPVREWSLLPNDETPERAQLLAQIHSILEHRGCGRTAEPSPPSSQRFWNQLDYPWTLVRLLPNAQQASSPYIDHSSIQRDENFIEAQKLCLQLCEKTKQYLSLFLN